ELYLRLPELQAALALQEDARSFLQLIAAFALETAEDVRDEGFSGDPELLFHCLDSFRYAALVSSLVEEFSAFNAARRYKWLRLALFRVGLAVTAAAFAGKTAPQGGLGDVLALRFLQEERGVAAFVDLARRPVPRIHPTVHIALKELTSLLCLEFSSAPSDEQLNLFQQSGLLGLAGGIGSPETRLLRRLSEQNGLAHAGTCRASIHFGLLGRLGRAPRPPGEGHGGASAVVGGVETTFRISRVHAAQAACHGSAWV
ncbi:unnamed protein product, partial [Symbiodinium sp. CCMP2456]